MIPTFLSVQIILVHYLKLAFLDTVWASVFGLLLLVFVVGVFWGGGFGGGFLLFCCCCCCCLGEGVCVRACVCACVRACVCVCLCVCVFWGEGVRGQGVAFTSSSFFQAP